MQINFCPVNFEQYLNGRNSQRLGREPWSSGYWEETHILKIVGLNSNIVLIIHAEIFQAVSTFINCFVSCFR